MRAYTGDLFGGLITGGIYPGGLYPGAYNWRYISRGLISRSL